MSAPARVVDLSLPDYATLVARAGVNPDAEAARVGSADPGVVSAAGGTLGRAGGEFDTAWARSRNAASTLGGAFVNDGAAVYDRGTHLRNLPAGFGEASSRLTGASRRVTAVAEDLSAAMRDTSAAVSGLHTELSRQRSGWAARVAAAGTGPGGLIPEAAVAGLLAERDRVAAAMTSRVGQVGRSVSQRIHGYEVVVNDALRLLADQGFVPVEDLDRPAPAAPRLEGGVDPTGFGTPLTAGYAADPVNTALGNFVEGETDLSFAGLPAGLTFARTYNSCSDLDGPLGARWSSWATAGLRVGSWTAEFESPDGQQVSFPRTGPAEFGRAAGIDALVEPAGPEPGAGWVLAWFDGRRWEFDPSGRIRRTWAGPGTGVAFRHDEGGRLVELTHERGRQIRVDWDAERARIVAVSGSDGRRVDYRYTGDRLVAAEGPGGSHHYGHDDAGRVTSVTDADGVVELVNTYDAAGRVLTQRSPFGRSVTFDYAADGSTVVADDSAGPRNTYRHDAAGRLVSVTDGHGRTQHTRYDRWGNPIEMVQRGGAVTRQEFDQRARLIRRSLPGGAVQTLSWDGHDRLVEVRVCGPDIASAVTRFGYEGAERIPSEIVDPEGGITRATVSDGVVTGVTDPDGIVLRFRYDAHGQLTEAVDAAGGVTRIERDAGGRPTAVTTPAGRRRELTHDGAGRLIERRDPTGEVWRYCYTAAGRLCTVVDPAGARTETRYGSHGEAVELVDALGALTIRRFDALGNLAALTAPDGAKSTFAFDALCRLTAWTGPGGGSWLHEYDVDGNPTATIDPTGVGEALSYDTAGRLVGVDDGLVTTAYAYDGLGRPIVETAADGSTRHVSYDRCGRRVSVTDPDGGVTHLSYTAAGRPAGIASPAGRTERYVHDDVGRLAIVVVGIGGCRRYRYDPDGLLVERTSPAGLVETFTRDEAGRVVRHRVPGRGTTDYGYDAAGRVVEVIDRAGRRRFTRDPVGRVVAATDALGHTTRYTYDAAGRLAAATDPLGHTTSYRYDEAGRLTGVTDPLGRTTRRTYDPAGRLREWHDPTGAHHTIDYDGSGRARRITATGGADRLTVTINRDRLGRPIRITETTADRVEETGLRWDRDGRLVERRSGPHAVGWSYDPDGLPTGRIDPGGVRTGYHHDDAGHLTAIEHPLLGRIDLRHDPDGRLLEMRDGQAATRFGYVEGWLTMHTTDVMSGRQRRSTRLTRNTDGRVTVADTDGRATFYGYDPAGQLCSVTDVAGECRFGYDAAGRLVTEAHPELGARRYSYDAAGQLHAIVGPDGEHHFGYDAAGRRGSEQHPDRSRRYDWDPLGRLTAVTTTVTPVRSPCGPPACVSMPSVNSPPSTTHPSRGTAPTPAARCWPSAAPRSSATATPGRRSVPAARAVSTRTGSTPRAGARSIRGARPPTSGDDGGIGLGHRGELVVDGLTWLRHRTYDPASRTFLQPDPLPPVPGTAYAANPYHYAGNDPVNALDPLGLRPLTDADLLAQRTAVGVGARYAGTPEYLLGGGPGAFALPTGVPLPAGADPYHGLSLVNGLLTAGDATGGMYGAKLELDAHYGKLTGQYEQGLARQNLGRLGQQSRVVNPSQFYDDLDHYSTLGRHGDALVADAARVERAGKFVPPKIGGALAVAGIGYDIATGKDPVQAVAAGGGGFLASVAAGAAIGTLIPIPGVGTAVGALGGAVVGTFASGAIDSLFENGLDVGEAGKRGLEAVTDTGKAIGGGLMKAAHGIGGLFH